MTRRIWIAIAFAAMPALSGCGYAIVGGAAAIGADAVAEDRQGGDGLF